MRADTSKQPENSSSQLIRKIAEGKRKGESYREALSLQDVFSDPQNSSCIRWKTSCLFVCEQENWRNLMKRKGEDQTESQMEAEKKCCNVRKGRLNFRCM